MIGLAINKLKENKPTPQTIWDMQRISVEKVQQIQSFGSFVWAFGKSENGASRSIFLTE